MNPAAPSGEGVAAPLVESLERRVAERIAKLEEALREARENGALYRAFTEMAMDAIVTVDEQHNIALFNPAAERMFGYSATEMVGLPLERLLPEPLRAAHREHVRKFHGGISAMARNAAVVGLRADGSQFPAEVSISRVTVAQGTFYTAVLRDVTERKGVEEALRKSEASLAKAQRATQELIEALPNPIFFKDTEGRYLGVNRAWETFFGTRREAFVGKTVHDLYPESPEVADRLRADDQMLWDKPGTPRVHEQSITTPDGARHDVIYYKATFRHADGGGAGLIGTIIDITERKQAEQALRESEARFRSLTALSSDWYWEQDENFRFRFMSGDLDANTGIKSDEHIGKTRWELPALNLTDPDWAEHRARLERHEPFRDFEMRRPDQHGRMHWVSISGEPTFDTGGRFTGYRGVGSDITKRVEQQRRIERLSRIRTWMGAVNALIVRAGDRDELHREACRIAVEHGGFGIAWIGSYDKASCTIRVKAWSGLLDETLTGRQISIDASKPEGQGVVGRAMREGTLVVNNDIDATPGVGVMRKQAARLGYRSVAALPLFVKDRVTHVMVLYGREAGFFDEDELTLLREMAADLSFSLEAMKKGARLAYLANYDPLTGLANRAFFEERLEHQLRTRADGETSVATLIFDLERLQVVNDTYGRGAGDELLKQFAQRLVNALGREEMLGRVVSDCFGAIVRGFKDANALAQMLEQTILPSLVLPFAIGAAELRMGVKAGIALFPADGDNAATLFRNAEAALRNAKDRGERYLFYSPEMNARVAEMLALETKLRRALEREEFVLHYQPKVDMHSGRVVGLEALIRWNDPDSGLVPPGLFIPVLERTGMIHEAGRWALRQALRDLRGWRGLGLVTRVAVNISLLQLRRGDFTAQIAEILGESAGDAGLDLELTESLLMDNIEDSIRKLNEIRGHGVEIAIDDFGTGYCSLTYLGRLPVNALKIDRSFVVNSTKGPDGLSLVSTIIALAHSFRFKVIAEGVDSEEQLKLLRLMRCDQWQGFLFSKAVPAAQVPRLLSAGT